METVKVDTSQNVTIDYPVAGLGERIAARLIDVSLLVVTGLVLMMLLNFPGAFTLPLGNIVMAVYVCICVFYFLGCELLMNGQSPGKRLMKIKVISQNGDRANLGQYFMRWLFRLVDFTLTGQVAGLIAVAVSGKKQRIGDLAAGTLVITTKPRAALSNLAFNNTDRSEDYVPVFSQVTEMTDLEAELIFEVLDAFQKTYNQELVTAMSAKVRDKLGIVVPAEMNDYTFLKTVLKDYTHLTSLS